MQNNPAKLLAAMLADPLAGEPGDEFLQSNWEQRVHDSEVAFTEWLNAHPEIKSLQEELNDLFYTMFLAVQADHHYKGLQAGAKLMLGLLGAEPGQSAIDQVQRRGGTKHD